MIADHGGFLVIDGHHNRVLPVTFATEVVTLGDVVRTGLESGARTTWVSLAGPVPHVPESGRSPPTGRPGSRWPGSSYSTLTAARLMVPGRDVPGQVRVPVAGVQHIHRHHREQLPSTPTVAAWTATSGAESH